MKLEELFLSLPAFTLETGGWIRIVFILDFRMDDAFGERELISAVRLSSV